MMTETSLTSSTIGVVREFIESCTTRGGLKGLALKSGAEASRVMKIRVSNDMNSSGYMSKATLMCELVDAVYEDFEKPEADGILLRMTALLIDGDNPMVRPEHLEALERGLAKSGLSIEQVTGNTPTVMLLETISRQAQASSMKEAHDLLAQGLLRLSTDKPGAITACTSACESVCRAALERLGVPLPKRKQLPEYVDALCDHTNIVHIARVAGEDTKQVFGALRGLARHSYRAAHSLGDRHAQGDNAQAPTATGADLVIVSCAALTSVIAGAVARNELRPIV